jgi:FkbM family methyltransferase
VPTPGKNPLDDIQAFPLPRRPIVFDVGANAGQTVRAFKTALPDAQVHSFEPSPTTFATLELATRNLPDVKMWNIGLGAEVGTLSLRENSLSDMSSFLDLDTFGWGEVERTTQVPVDTIDRFAAAHSIGHIDVLKTDTQGFDLQVLRGAREMMRADRISLVLCEIIVSPMYKELPGMAETLTLLRDNGFVLVTFYEFAYQRGLASWTDGLFVHKSIAGSAKFG